MAMPVLEGEKLPLQGLVELQGRPGLELQLQGSYLILQLPELPGPIWSLKAALHLPAAAVVAGNAAGPTQPGQAHFAATALRPPLLC